MFTSRSSRRKFFEPGDKQRPWTPRAVAVLATAKHLSLADHRITAGDILLALECGDHQVSCVFRSLGISPSVALGRPVPASWALKRNLSSEDFDASLAGFPQLVSEEAEGMGDSHLGIEHLLLFLARVGVAGVDLPYEKIKQAWLTIMGRD